MFFNPLRESRQPPLPASLSLLSGRESQRPASVGRGGPRAGRAHRMQAGRDVGAHVRKRRAPVRNHPAPGGGPHGVAGRRPCARTQARAHLRRALSRPAAPASPPRPTTCFGISAWHWPPAGARARVPGVSAAVCGLHAGPPAGPQGDCMRRASQRGFLGPPPRSCIRPCPENDCPLHVPAIFRRCRPKRSSV